MTSWCAWTPTLAAAHARIAAVRPADYARSRNALTGAVSGLSPYITHGVVSVPEVLAGVAAHHTVGVHHAWVFELGWREYFQHVWQHRGADIFQDLHPGPLPASAYAFELPADIRQARTGLPVIDHAVRALYETGYVHNHARMWLASYIVHLRKVHWRCGADWMVAHLLDGDLASNHLSWQWVAGTGSRKPYLFNADNVAQYAPPAWHVPGSVLDVSYATLNAMARDPHPMVVCPLDDGMAEPCVSVQPPDGTPPQAIDVAGRDVWLVHPWALGEPPLDLPPGCLRLGWWPTQYHAAWPWSPARWHFVATRMAALAPVRWQGSQAQLAQALRGARSVHTHANLHINPYLPPTVQRYPAQSLFAPPERLCASFFVWWKQVTRHASQITDLPGLRMWLSASAQSLGCHECDGL